MRFSKLTTTALAGSLLLVAPACAQDMDAETMPPPTEATGDTGYDEPVASEPGPATEPYQEPAPAEPYADSATDAPADEPYQDPATSEAPAPSNPAATIDSNGDGTMDAWDQRGNGKADTWDTNGDGQPDAVDADGDSQPDPA